MLSTAALIQEASSPIEKVVPVIDTSAFLQDQPAEAECKAIAQALRDYGCVIIRDPRVNESHNSEFLDMMEKYFEKRSEVFYSKQKVEEIKPEYHYQVGATPEYTEKARDHKEKIEQLSVSNKPLTESPPPFDAKWRFFWRMDEETPEEKRADNFPQVIPTDFSNWQETMNQWGNLMLGCVKTASEMLATGLGLEKDAFTSRMKEGNHLLAPTGSDLARYKEKTIFAGFHYDLNFLTIHGKSRFPGLMIWLRTGEKMPVSMPDGCLLIQAGIQIEMLTAGYISAGFHEVIYNEKTEAAFQKAKENNKSTWRVSSTLFSHISSNVILEPLPQFKHLDTTEKYKPISAHDQVMEELRKINLSQSLEQLNLSA